MKAPLPLLISGLGIAQIVSWGSLYYPIAVLPPVLQAVSYALPPAHVFEGMRAVLLERAFHVDMLLSAPSI